ncbi:DUF3558 domain-containing protein [Nocardia cyriacigeorgica]|uniref:DUF3558 domain-containing protein n=1 Tax=Nocardia cyriacigeorgica TaxID=135487 RepID=UPI002453EBEE|nr:DUF3558 domain-containing protein [Nocardia cyriacigeorgica]
MMLVAGVVVPGIVACGGSTEGSPTAEGSASAAPVALFDPCTAIPDEALTTAGVDPAAVEKGAAGVDQAGWEICTWQGRQHSVTVFSTGLTVQDFEQKPGNVEFEDVTVGGRQGRQFRVAGASKDLLCDVVFPAEQGVVQLRVMSNVLLDDPADPCVTIQDVGKSIVPILPN